ncbi:MAF protein [Mycolicibacterium chubuense NBB4]|uniref:Nucleoside triphosphate pyrophosphatase n=2 Tax=Mycolicibacterium chubuense TaxID=1800 RepID=I4BFN7_MYCCN|nr:MAF protein [Mycolicibacterium chubuense NBB4]
MVLASRSPARLKLLRQAGVDPFVMVPTIDEEALAESLSPTSPEDVVLALARAKASDVVARLPGDILSDCIVLGCDTLLLLGNDLYGKPGSTEAAVAQWKIMSGAIGRILTGHALLRVKAGSILSTETRPASADVYFGNPTDEEVAAYVTSGEPIETAGAFTLDGLGGWFVERIEGHPSTVIGLSLPELYQMVCRTGLSLHALWRSR